MSRSFEATVYYGVVEQNRPALHIDAALEGQSWPLSVQGHDVTVRFPMRSENPVALTHTYRGSSGGPAKPISLDLVVVEARVRFEIDPATEDFEAEDRETNWAAFNRLDDAIAAADEAVQRLWAGARTRQAWLGMAKGGPRRLGVQVTDLSSDTLVDAQPTIESRGFHVAHMPETTLDRGTVEAILGDESPPALPESFLADAWHVVAYREPKDPARAVLLAAIALDVKAKAVLQAAAHPEAQALLSYMLENPRAFPAAAAELTTKLAQVVAGRSLKDHDPRVSKGIVRLFELRNAVAHKGQVPTPEEALTAVQAAGAAFTWLDSLADT